MCAYIFLVAPEAPRQANVLEANVLEANVLEHALRCELHSQWMQHLFHVDPCHRPFAHEHEDESVQDMRVDEHIVMESMYMEKYRQEKTALATMSCIVLAADQLDLMVYLQKHSRYPMDVPALFLRRFHAQDTKEAMKELMVLTQELYKVAMTLRGEPMMYALCQAVEAAVQNEMITCQGMSDNDNDASYRGVSRVSFLVLSVVCYTKNKTTPKPWVQDMLQRDRSSDRYRYTSIDSCLDA